MKSQQSGITACRPRWTFKLEKSRSQNTSSLETFLYDYFAKSFLPQQILTRSLLWKEASKLGKILHHHACYNVYSRHMAATLQYLCLLKGSVTPYLLWLSAPCPPPHPVSELATDIKYNSSQDRQGTSMTSQVPPLCVYLLQF